MTDVLTVDGLSTIMLLMALEAMYRACDRSTSFWTMPDFTRTERRTLRKSDGTAVIEGRRFEVPNRYRHLARWRSASPPGISPQVHLVDPHTGAVLCRLFPQD